MLAESDFLRLRQTAQVSSADFHRWLTLARLLAVSNGHKCTGIDHWTEAMRMERLRIDRV